MHVYFLHKSFSSRKSWEEKAAKAGPRFHAGILTDEVDGQALRRAKALYGTLFQVLHIIPSASSVLYAFCEYKADELKQRGDKRKDWQNRSDEWRQNKVRKNEVANFGDDWKKRRQCFVLHFVSPFLVSMSCPSGNATYANDLVTSPQNAGPRKQGFRMEQCLLLLRPGSEQSLLGNVFVVIVGQSLVTATGMAML